VAATIRSASRSTPSAVRTPVRVIRSIGVVMSAVLGLLSAVKNALEMTGRLARMPMRGTSALR
jgi:hypothetical protein